MDEFIEFSKLIAHLSGRIINRYFRSGLKVEIKSDQSPVTIADKKAEEEMRKLIRQYFPQHGILGEEFGQEKAEADYQWVLDPIDGTKSFISGVPLFGTLIALLYQKKPILGVMHLPVLKELIIGTPNQTLLNNKIIRMRECSQVSEAVLLATDQLQITQFQDGRKFEQLINKVKFYRTWGDCFGYYLLASGFADIMVDPVMNLWDSAAIIPIIQGAGGVVSDYQGNDPVNGHSLIAAGPALHRQVISLLN